MVIFAIDERDVDGKMRQMYRGIDAGKSAANDNNPFAYRAAVSHGSCSFWSASGPAVLLYFDARRWFYDAKPRELRGVFGG